VFLILLIKIIASDADAGEMTQPPWMRVLAMEIIRGYVSIVLYLDISLTIQLLQLMQRCRVYP
jgi:hypothetical protein